jgi:DNA-binding transcriptional MerR regulator
MADRAHLSIGEVLSLVQEDFPDVTISKIRFLESQGLLDPERTPSGYRKFYSGDIERLQWILTQQRDHFLPLKVIRERLDEWDATGTRPAAEGALPSAGDESAGAEPEGARGDVLTATRPEPEELDPRHAAASLAAASAIEVEHGRDEPDAPDAAPEPEPPAAPPAEPETAPAGDFRVGPSSTSLTAQELADRVGVDVSVVAELEGYSLIESRRIGPESYFEPSAIAVAEACRRFLDHGMEVRHLRMYKIAAEREAGVFEQLVMPLLKQRNPAAKARAVEMVRSLAEVGEAMHAALLRNALSDTLP